VLPVGFSAILLDSLRGRAPRVRLEAVVFYTSAAAAGLSSVQ
jgi:hypothetical protein